MRPGTANSSRRHTFRTWERRLDLTPTDGRAGQKYCSLRSVQIWEIFKDEFIDDSRLVKVIATQSSNITITNIRFDALNDPAINPNYTMPDVTGYCAILRQSLLAGDLPPDVPNYPTIDEILRRYLRREIN